MVILAYYLWDPSNPIEAKAFGNGIWTQSWGNGPMFPRRVTGVKNG